MKAEAMIATAVAAFVAFLVLVALILWFRGEAIKAKADAKQWRENAEVFERANKQNAFAAEQWQKAAVANAAIADALSGKVREIAQQNAAASAAVEKVYANDPNARAWADTVVPVGVRDASETRH